MNKIKNIVSQIFLILAIWFLIYIGYFAGKWGERGAYKDNGVVSTRSIREDSATYTIVTNATDEEFISGDDDEATNIVGKARSMQKGYRSMFEVDKFNDIKIQKKPVKVMSISPHGVNFIKSLEGFSAKAKWDRTQCSNGYGTSNHRTKANCEGSISITKNEATKRFDAYIKTQQKRLNNLVKVRVVQNKWDALSSFSYNIGIGEFKNSTLLKLLNAGDRDGALKQFSVWNKKDGVVSAGLVSRRAKESVLFASR